VRKGSKLYLNAEMEYEIVELQKKLLVEVLSLRMRGANYFSVSPLLLLAVRSMRWTLSERDSRDSLRST